MTDLDAHLGFTSRGCTCRDVTAAIRAAVNGQDAPLCPVHQSDELAARRTAKAKRDAEVEAEKLHQAHEARVARDAEAAAERQAIDAAALRERQLAAMDPLEAQLYRISGAPIVSPDTAIGDDAAFVKGLARVLGIPPSAFNNDPEPPQAA